MYAKQHHDSKDTNVQDLPIFYKVRPKHLIQLKVLLHQNKEAKYKSQEDLLKEKDLSE